MVKRSSLKRVWERGFQPQQPCECKRGWALRRRKSGQRSLECNVEGGPGCNAGIGPVHRLTLSDPRRSLVLALYKHRLHHQGGRINLLFLPHGWVESGLSDNGRRINWNKGSNILNIIKAIHILQTQTQHFSKMEKNLMQFHKNQKQGRSYHWPHAFSCSV